MKPLEALQLIRTTIDKAMNDSDSNEEDLRHVLRLIRTSASIAISKANERKLPCVAHKYSANDYEKL